MIRLDIKIDDPRYEIIQIYMIKIMRKNIEHDTEVKTYHKRNMNIDK